MKYLCIFIILALLAGGIFLHSWLKAVTKRLGGDAVVCGNFSSAMSMKDCPQFFTHYFSGSDTIADPVFII